MRIKNQMSSLLEARRGCDVSAATIADALSLSGIQPHLAGDVDAALIRVLDTVESTNKTAKELALAGCEHGTVIVANHQTAGRGRRERSFYSPAGGGLYMSIILRPERLWVTTPTLVTAQAAVAVCGAIEVCGGGTPSVKWVNDVFVGGKKACGILAEAVTDFKNGGISWIVVGIGVNVNTTQFPDELRGIAGSAFCDGGGDRNRVCAEIVNRMVSEAHRLPQDAVLEHYRARLFMLGREVTVTAPNEVYRAVAMSVDDEGRLVVRRGDGSTAALTAGEISTVATTISAPPRRSTRYDGVHKKPPNLPQLYRAKIKR